MNEKIPHITESALHFLYLHTCGWCKKRLSKDKIIFESDNRHVQAVDLNKYEGKIMPLSLAGIKHSVLAFVKDENGLIFHFCGLNCKKVFEEQRNRKV